MLALWITLGSAAFLALASLITAYVCFRLTFYSSPKTRFRDKEEIQLPEGRIYEEFREPIVKWIKAARELPHENICIKSPDGLRLYGRYYEYEKGAPIELLLHGYRGTAERDVSGGIARCFALGRNALIADHRASGECDGKVITFGVKESDDCLAWVNYIINNIDKDAKIIITGVSMGAATVMITAAREELPENVIGVLADCGYTSAKAIIKKVISDMKLPADILYPFVKLGARIFGGFDPDSASPIEAMKKSRVPVYFVHGDTDRFVPYEMSVENYEACTAKKTLVTIEGAGHGLCFPKDQEKYISTLREFFDPIIEERGAK